MNDEAVALLRLMAKMNAEVVRPAQILREKNMLTQQNGYNGNPTVRDNGEPSRSGVHGVDVPLQGPFPELSFQGVSDVDHSATGNGALCEPDLNLQPKKQ